MSKTCHLEQGESEKLIWKWNIDNLIAFKNTDNLIAFKTFPWNDFENVNSFIDFYRKWTASCFFTIKYMKNIVKYSYSPNTYDKVFVCVSKCTKFSLTLISGTASEEKIVCSSLGCVYISQKAKNYLLTQKEFLPSFLQRNQKYSLKLFTSEEQTNKKEKNWQLFFSPSRF